MLLFRCTAQGTKQIDHAGTEEPYRKGTQVRSECTLWREMMMVRKNIEYDTE
jgi:hypothetical protein